MAANAPATMAPARPAALFFVSAVVPDAVGVGVDVDVDVDGVGVDGDPDGVDGVAFGGAGHVGAALNVAAPASVHVDPSSVRLHVESTISYIVVEPETAFATASSGLPVGDCDDGMKARPSGPTSPATRSASGTAGFEGSSSYFTTFSMLSSHTLRLFR